MCEDIKLVLNLNCFFSHSCRELNNLLLQHNKIKCIGKLHFQNLGSISSRLGSAVVYPSPNGVWCGARNTSSQNGWKSSLCNPMLKFLKADLPGLASIVYNYQNSFCFYFNYYLYFETLVVFK